MSEASHIAKLNDLLRTTGLGGKTFITSGVHNLGDTTRDQVLYAVRNFNNFTEDNDPYGEHDFGSIVVDDIKIYWKIDYYDKDCKFGSENPADLSVTTRVMTIMLAEEY